MRALGTGRARVLALTVVLLAAEGDASTATLPPFAAALEEIADELGIAEDGGVGRLDDSDEERAFGNPVFARVFADRSARHVRDRRPGGDVSVFHVMAVWGRIQPRDDVPPRPLRWDPVLSVPDGDAIFVRRELRFERGDRVHPQRVPHEEVLRSATGPHVDGVVVQVLISDADAGAASFRFRSGPISFEIPFRDLAGLNEFHPVDRTGNGLMLVAVERPSTAGCASGFMGGRWAVTRDDGGVFGGAWRTATGRAIGHVAGRFGEDREGSRVLHAKVIGRDGEFLGSLAGSYGEGAYRGELFGRGGDLLGAFEGHYTAGDDGGHGLFRGVWRQTCSEASCPCDFRSALLAAKRNAKGLGVEFPRLRCVTCIGIAQPDGDIAVVGGTSNVDIELSAVPGCDTPTGLCCNERREVGNDDGDVSDRLEVRGTREAQHDACVAELHRVARELGLECIPLVPPGSGLP